jgi:hypothetical protein
MSKTVEKQIKNTQISLDSFTLASDLADVLIKDKYKDPELIFDYDEVNDCYIYKESISNEYEEMVENLNDYLINQYSNLNIYARNAIDNELVDRERV